MDRGVCDAVQEQRRFVDAALVPALLCDLRVSLWSCYLAVGLCVCACLSLMDVASTRREEEGWVGSATNIS